METEQQIIKQAIENGMKKGRLNKIIGDMATNDLDYVYDMVTSLKGLPTAEELVDEINRRGE